MTYGDALSWAVAATFVTVTIIIIFSIIVYFIYQDFGKKGLKIFSGVVLAVIAYFNLVALFVYFVSQ